MTTFNVLGSHSFQAVQSMLSWSAAGAAAADLGGHLATITSAAENVAVSSFGTGRYWIGATDDANDTDSVFTWVTGEAWSYTNFALGEPDDDAGFGGTGEALFLTAETGAWADTNPDFVGFVDGYVVEYESFGDIAAATLAGADTFNGSDGDDSFFGNAGADVYEAGGGTDTISYAASAAGVRVNLRNALQAGGDAQGDSLTGLESVEGSALRDVLTGDSLGNTLLGGSGRDTLRGYIGTDSLAGGDGADELTGGRGADTLTGGAGGDTFLFLARNELGDTITDFSSAGAGGNDSFAFLGTAFGGLAAGSLSTGQFQASIADFAKTEDVRFFYERDTGILRFDEDGSGAAAAVIVALLQADARLAIEDIIIV